MIIFYCQFKITIGRLPLLRTPYLLKMILGPTGKDYCQALQAWNLCGLKSKALIRSTKTKPQFKKIIFTTLKIPPTSRSNICSSSTINEIWIPSFLSGIMLKKYNLIWITNWFRLNKLENTQKSSWKKSLNFRQRNLVIQ